MTLEELGYTGHFETFRKQQNLSDFEVGRISSEHKERYGVKTTNGEYEGEIIGNLRFTATERADFPAVGDWVAISEYDTDKVLIHAVFERKSILERKAVGYTGSTQIIATNIDYGFILQAVDRDFSINRLERYLTLCNSSGIQSVILLNKIDRITPEELSERIEQVRNRIEDVPLIAISNVLEQGIEPVKQFIEKGKTYCLLGSSGVGKSTLLNNLMGQAVMKTGNISDSSERGKHITSYRALYILPDGGILIDNPGMREIGMADFDEGLELTFDSIADISKNCKFRDCTHTTETGCAVIRAVQTGEVDETSYENFLKLEREKTHYERSVAEKRQRDKDFGKMMKQYKKSSFKK